MNSKSKQNIVPLTKHKLFAVFCLFCSFTLSAQTVYKTVHADGTVTYSDQPTPGAVEIQLNVPTNTMKSKPDTSIINPQIKPTPKVKYQLSVLSPADNATIRDNTGKISIATSIEPRAAGVYQLTINGDVHESQSGVFSLTEMNRGTYEYSVKFIDNSGKVIASTQPRNLYLHQASALIN